MRSDQSKLGFRVKASIVALLCATASASASAVTITSSAYDVLVNLTVLNTATASLGPVGPVSGTAAPAYTYSTTIASLESTLGLGSSLGTAFNQGVQTGVLVTTATSGFTPTPTGDASATVNNLALGLTSKLGLLPAITILDIGSNTVVSRSSVDGIGSPTATGFTSLAGLTLSGTALGALTVDGSLLANPAANTQLLNLLGLRIVLNEQIPSGDGITSAGIITNAIDVSFTNFLLGTNLLNGNIIVGHSQAAIDGVTPMVGVPEPATWLQFIAGFGVIGLIFRRRGSATVTA